MKKMSKAECMRCVKCLFVLAKDPEELYILADDRWPSPAEEEDGPVRIENHIICQGWQGVKELEKFLAKHFSVTVKICKLRRIIPGPQIPEYEEHWRFVCEDPETILG